MKSTKTLLALATLLALVEFLPAMDVETFNQHSKMQHQRWVDQMQRDTDLWNQRREIERVESQIMGIQRVIPNNEQRQTINRRQEAKLDAQEREIQWRQEQREMARQKHEQVQQEIAAGRARASAERERAEEQRRATLAEMQARYKEASERRRANREKEANTEKQ